MKSRIDLRIPFSFSIFEHHTGLCQPSCQLLPHQVRNAVGSQLGAEAGTLAACEPVPPSLGSFIQGAGFMGEPPSITSWVMDERVLHAQPGHGVSFCSSSALWMDLLG